MHIDDLYIVIPKGWTHEKIGTNERRFFFYCALTPTIAVISSPFIRLPNKLPYAWAETKDPNFSFNMNINTHRRASSVLISHQAKPYGVYQNMVIHFLESILYPQPTKGIKFLIYTNKARYSLNVDAYELIEGPNLFLEVHFWTKDMKTLHMIAQDDVIEVVHYFENDIEKGGTRNLKLHCVSLYPNEPSVMKAYW